MSPSLPQPRSSDIWSPIYQSRFTSWPHLNDNKPLSVSQYSPVEQGSLLPNGPCHHRPFSQTPLPRTLPPGHVSNGSPEDTESHPVISADSSGSGDWGRTSARHGICVSQDYVDGEPQQLTLTGCQKMTGSSLIDSGCVYAHSAQIQFRNTVKSDSLSTARQPHAERPT